jgi:CHASE2 domain-containing sensor protein
MTLTEQWCRKHSRLIAVVASAFVATLVFWIDPFEFGSKKMMAIDQAIAMINQLNYDSLGKEKLAVVLIDQDSMDNWGADWPLSYTSIADVVHSISCQHALGIFFDFTLSSKLENQKLANQIAQLPSSDLSCPNGRAPDSIPVFFGRIEGLNTPMQEIANKHFKSFFIDGPTGDNIYPPGREQFTNRTPPRDQASPAFGITRYFCANNVALLCSRAESAIRPIDITWNAVINPFQSKTLDLDRCRGTVTRLEIFASTVAKIFGVDVALSAKSSQEFCPPIFTLTAMDLNRNYGYIKRNMINPAAFLNGRFVLVGANLAGLNDRIYSPVNGWLPGVYIHAMALDNLLTLENDYKTVPQPLPTLLFVFVLYAATESSLKARLNRIKKANPNGERIRWMTIIALWSLGYAISSYLCWTSALIIKVLLYYGGVFKLITLLFGQYRKYVADDRKNL